MKTEIRVALSEYLEDQPDGIPSIRGRRIPVDFVAAYARRMTFEAIVEEFSLTPMQILAALLYVEQNREFIEQIRAEQARDDGSLLAATCSHLAGRTTTH